MLIVNSLTEDGVLAATNQATEMEIDPAHTGGRVCRIDCLANFFVAESLSSGTIDRVQPSQLEYFSQVLLVDLPLSVSANFAKLPLKSSGVSFHMHVQNACALDWPATGLLSVPPSYLVFE